MGYLIDTHVLILYINGNKALPGKYIELIADPQNILYVSIASLWEITIKLSLKKLELNKNFSEVEAYILSTDFKILDISFTHLNNLLKLPQHHGDPFDRLLIAQAITEGFTIISADRHFSTYDVSIIW